MKKYFLIPAVLSLAVLCMLGDSAFAQRGGRGGGRGGGGWGGGGWGGGRSGWYGGYGGYGGYGNGWWGGYGGYSPYYSGTPYYSDYYYNTTPSYSYYPSTDNYSSPAPMVNNNSASIRVIVPDPNAQVFLDGQRTYSTGNERIYQTPPLSGAKTFSYQLRATFMQNGQQMTQERTIMVTPGQTTTVDFTRPQ